MNSAIEILRITFPIYLAIGVGYGAVTWGIFDRTDMRVFGKFIVNFAFPALLFNALSRQSVAEIFNFQYIAAYLAGTLAVLIFGMFWTYKIQEKPLTYSGILTMGMCCPNSGFIGYPVISVILGNATAGIVLALNTIVENIVLIPLLLVIAEAGASKGNWRHVIKQIIKELTRNPMIWGIALGLAFSIAGAHPSEPITKAINLFSAASPALSLFVIGGSLVRLNHRGLKSAVTQVAMTKLVIHPVMMLGVLLFLVTVDTPALRSAALISSAVPMMGLYTVLAQRFGYEDVSAAALLVTTVCSFVTLTSVLWLIKAFPI